MSNNFEEFQKKVKIRQFAIDNSWRGDSGQHEQNTLNGPDQSVWDPLVENLSEADVYKFNNGYFEIHSHRKILGPIIVFFKKAVRKLLKIFLGWYLFPVFTQQNNFNVRILNAVSLERNILVATDERVLTLESQVMMLENQVSKLQKQLKKIENLPTDDEKFYHDFEEKFRGSREDIRDRLQAYVPIVKKHLSNWADGRFVDIGSGRGEWLDILKANGAVDYVGIDLNAEQNAICESFGHRTICEDCIKYLSEQPDKSIDMISGFQIIEHLCMSDLMELLTQSYRTLKNGGMVLFETPNPRNLVVSAETFYTDPSHKRPLDPKVMEFIVQRCGFTEIMCIDANSNPNWKGITKTEKNEDNKEIVEKINDIYWLLYGPQDYAIVAIKG